MRHCVGCGREIAEHVTVCPYCFTSQVTGEARPEPASSMTPPVGAPPTNGGALPPPQAWGPPRPSAIPPAAVPSYLVQSILCTLFCCLPFGIVGIVYAAQVNSKLGIGDYYGAVETSKKARTWCWASFITGLVVGVIYFLVLFAARYTSTSTAP